MHAPSNHSWFDSKVKRFNLKPNEAVMLWSSFKMESFTQLFNRQKANPVFTLTSQRT